MDNLIPLRTRQFGVKRPRKILCLQQSALRRSRSEYHSLRSLTLRFHQYHRPPHRPLIEHLLLSDCAHCLAQQLTQRTAMKRSFCCYLLAREYRMLVHSKSSPWTAKYLPSQKLLEKQRQEKLNKLSIVQQVSPVTREIEPDELVRDGQVSSKTRHVAQLAELPP